MILSINPIHTFLRGKMKSHFTLNQLELKVHLGWEEWERLHLQTVWVDIHIQFEKPPRACLTDSLEDTMCYGLLTEKIKLATVHKSFRLIEYLTQVIYQTIKENDTLPIKVKVGVRKKPAIDNLNGGVQFWYGEIE